jgi:hypothetical protein
VWTVGPPQVRRPNPGLSVWELACHASPTTAFAAQRDRTAPLSGPPSPRFTPPSPSLLSPRSGRSLPRAALGSTPPELSTLGVHERCMLMASTVDLLLTIWRQGGRCRSLAQVSGSYWVARGSVSAGAVAAPWCCTFSRGSSKGLLVCGIVFIFETRGQPCDQAP